MFEIALMYMGNKSPFTLQTGFMKAPVTFARPGAVVWLRSDEALRLIEQAPRTFRKVRERMARGVPTCEDVSTSSTFTTAGQLKHELVLRRLSISKFARLLGVSQPFLSMVLSGKKRFPERLQKQARRLLAEL